MLNTNNKIVNLRNSLNEWYEFQCRLESKQKTKENNKHENILWNQFLIDLRSAVNYWVKKEIYKKTRNASNDKEKVFYSINDLASVSYLQLVRGFYGDKKTKLTKAFLFENTKNRSINATMAYLKQGCELNQKDYKKKFCNNKFKNNFKKRIKKILEEKFLKSTNEEKKKIAEQLLIDKKQGNIQHHNNKKSTTEYSDTEIDIKFILNKPSNENFKKELIEAYQNTTGNGANRRIKNQIIEIYIQTLIKIPDLKGITFNQLADVLYTIFDGRKGSSLSLDNFVHDDEEEINRTPYETISNDDANLTGNSAEEDLFKNFVCEDEVLMTTARNIVNDCFRQNTKGKSKKQLQAFLVDQASKNPDYMFSIGYPREIIDRIEHTQAQLNQNKKEENNATLVGIILNENTETAFYQIKRFKSKLQSKFNALYRTSNRLRREEDKAILGQYVLIFAIEKFGQEANNYLIVNHEQDNDDKGEQKR